MCVMWTSEWETSDQDMIAYKIVRIRDDGSYASSIRPNNRACQDILSTGDDLEYVIDSEMESGGHGLYLCSDLRDAESLLNWYVAFWHMNSKGCEKDKYAILRVTIPVGAEIREAVIQAIEINCINAKRIKVEEKV